MKTPHSIVWADPLRRSIKNLAGRLGLVIEQVGNDQDLNDPAFSKIYSRCREYSRTSVSRFYALFNAINYIMTNKVEGDIVECGVWRGGSSMCAALRLLDFGVVDRHLYLYDTYSGMSRPTERDVDAIGRDAATMWNASQRIGHNRWEYVPLEIVERNMQSTGYPPDRMVFVKGKVEDTIPGTTPEKIALLRLDTDFFESTKHELVHLFPLISSGGVLIVDDYGHWQGARMAVDEYIKEHSIAILLNRIDYTGRIGIKC